MKLIKIYLFLCFLLSVKVIAQENIKVGLLGEEQPRNSDMLSINENISIPIFTIKSGSITYPISLTYNMSGIGVDDIASDVGLGWQLSESFVYREIKDKSDVDESEGGVFPAWSATGYEGQNPTLYSKNIKLIKKRGFQKVKANNLVEHYDTNIGTLDHEPDIFNIVSPYFSTSFYFPYSLYEAKELYNNNTKIQGEINQNTIINYSSLKLNVGGSPLLGQNRIFSEYKKFNIVQSNGVISSFEEPDFIHTVNMLRTKLNYAGDKIYGQNKADNINIPTVEKWHVTKVIDPITTKEINFAYDTYSSEIDHENTISNYKNQNKPYFREGVSFKYNYNPATGNFVTNDCYIFHDTGEDDPTEYSRIYKRYLKKKRLKKISFDQGSINFIYGEDRQDFKNGKALTRIEVKNNQNQLITSYDLSYDYFNSEQYRNEFSKRLKLKSITSIDGGKTTFEYYEDNKMPQIGTFNKDFYGFCNTSNDDLVNPDDAGTFNYPIYYYYPDKYEFSLLPYQIAGQKNFFIEGSVNKAPNDLAKTWSLKKIVYPTGGYTQYNLENNVFSLWGNDLKGPGIRISSKIIGESITDINSREIFYNYKLQNGSSSGTIYNFPLAGYPVKKLFDSYEDDFGTVFSAGSIYNGEPNLWKSFLLYQALSKSNAKINYSVIEKKELNKKTIFGYETQINKVLRSDRHFYPTNGINDFFPHCISEFLKTNSGLGFDNNRFLMQNPTYTKIYDNNLLVKEIQYNYKNNLNKELKANFSPSNNYFHEMPVRNASTTFDIHPRWNYENLLTLDKKYFTRSNYLVEEKEKSFFSSGNIEQTSKNYYDSTISPSDPMLKGREITDNLGNSRSFNYEYTDERHSALIAANMLSTSIGIRKEKNNTQISRDEIIYDPTAILPSEVRHINDRQNQKTDVVFDVYDDKGNLISYKDSDGILMTILYGYNQTLPIAIIKGTNYNTLAQDLHLPSNDASEYLELPIVKKSNLDIDTPSENLLITELQNFRNQLFFRENIYQITTYTYDPLIGVTSVTPPTGMMQKYIYSTITNKLEKIIDKDGNILKEFKYNYKH